ncbi:hypothetical protein ES703_17343 [subsurface metagenome]
MLNLFINKLEQEEDGVTITAFLYQPRFSAEKEDFDTAEGYSEALAEHCKRTDEYHQLRLGSAHLEQTAGG